MSKILSQQTLWGYARNDIIDVSWWQWSWLLTMITEVHRPGKQLNRVLQMSASGPNATSIGVISGRREGPDPHFLEWGRTPHFISTPRAWSPHFSDQSYTTGSKCHTKYNNNGHTTISCCFGSLTSRIFWLLPRCSPDLVVSKVPGWNIRPPRDWRDEFLVSCAISNHALQGRVAVVVDLIDLPLKFGFWHFGSEGTTAWGAHPDPQVA